MLIVEDTGIGIPDEEKEKVFEQFYRCKTAVEPGCGLGLSIVWEIAQANEGKIKLSNREGGGTTVVVSFKAKDKSMRHGKKQ